MKKNTMENLTKEQTDRLVKCVEALRVMSDPHGKFDTDYLKGKYDAYAAVIGLIPIVKMNPIPTEKEIMFCDKCGEAYQTKLPHECYVASGSVAAPKELNEDQKLVHEVHNAHDLAVNAIDKLFDRLSSLKELVREQEEALKELLPIGETGLTYQESLNGRLPLNRAVIERARKLIEK